MLEPVFFHAAGFPVERREFHYSNITFVNFLVKNTESVIYFKSKKCKQFE